MVLGDTTDAFGPVIALVVVGLLAVALRWTFGSRRGGRMPRTRSGDTGLLRPVSVVATRAEANAARAVLSDAGIRSTVDARADGRVAVLVFAEDVDRARTVVPPAQ